MKDGHEKLPSGKNILRQNNEPGPGMKLHYYADGHKIKIGIQFTYGNGVKIDETYFLKGNMVGRKAYEKARTAYPDMPAPDDKTEDWGAALLSMVAKERQQHMVKSRTHTPDPEEARDADAFCLERISEGKSADVKVWIKDKRHSLGEMDWKDSKSSWQNYLPLAALKFTRAKLMPLPAGLKIPGISSWSCHSKSRSEPPS
jgi:hypothetical protein